MTASLLEQLADLPKAEGDALIRAMAPGEAPRVARWCGPNRWRRSTMRSVAPTMSPPLLTNRNLLKPCPSPARWSGSRRRRTKAELWRLPRRQERRAAPTELTGDREPMVRIHLPPAESHANFVRRRA